MNLKYKIFSSTRSNLKPMETFRIVAVVRREVFKIENCKDGSTSLIIDRKMEMPEIENSQYYEKLVSASINQIVCIKGLKKLTGGLLAGNIYLDGKHLSYCLGSDLKITAQVS